MLKLKEERRLTQVAIDDIVVGVTSMIDQSVSHVKAAIRAKLSDIDVDISDVPGFEDVFSELQQPFNGLETLSKQEKYFKDFLSLLVSYCISTIDMCIAVTIVALLKNFRNLKRYELVTLNMFHDFVAIKER